MGWGRVMGILYWCGWIWFCRDGLRADKMKPMHTHESYWMIPRPLGDWS